MDSRALVNVLGYKDFLHIMQEKKARLQLSKAKLKLYDGMFIIPLGQYILQAEYLGKVYRLKFLVIWTAQKPLLLTKTSELINLINY